MFKHFVAASVMMVLLPLLILAGTGPAHADTYPSPRGSTHDTAGKTYPKRTIIVHKRGQRSYVCVIRLYVFGPGRRTCFVPDYF